MVCFGMFEQRDDNSLFYNFYSILDKEPKTIQLLIKVSDMILYKMTAPRMVKNALECFSEADICLDNYRRAYSLTENRVVKEYCKKRIKEALDTRTVVSTYLPQTKAKNITKLIEKLFEESRSEKYHPKDFLDIDSAYDPIY